jgi:SpoVK/Ycf46/Vps4 family AAA+-type ATPase
MLLPVDNGRILDTRISNMKLAMEYVSALCLHNTSLLVHPDTKWDNAAGNAGGAKHTLCEAIKWLCTHWRALEVLGLQPPQGVMLPRCAKMMLARAATGVEGVAFLLLGPTGVYATSYTGNAEAAVRQAFDLARSAALCALFFYKINAIVDGGNGGNSGNQGGNGMGHSLSVEVQGRQTSIREESREGERDPQMEDGGDQQGGGQQQGIHTT